MKSFRILRVWSLAALFAAAGLTNIVCAQTAANLGNLNVSGRRIVFKNVVAVRGKSSGEDCVVVLATAQPITTAVLRAVKDNDAEDNLDREMDQSYLKAVFQGDGVLRCLIGKGTNSFFMERNAPLEGRATITDGRIRGSVKLIKTGDFAKEVTLAFDVPIDAPAKVAGPAKLDPPVKAAVSGKFIGDGKAAAIKFVRVEEHEPFSGKEAVTLIFTEKDPATAKKPSFDALFGKLGSALILNVHHDGGIFGCQVAHSAHSKSGFTSLGQIHMVEFEVAGGNVTGQVSTGGTLDTFGQKWEVDLKFAAPLPEKLRTASLAPPKPAAKEAPPVAVEAPAKPAKAAAVPAISARKLPLPSDAKDVQFKALVQQIHFASGLPVEAVANELSVRLKQQGWKDGVGGVKGSRSAILKREQGDAKLTIMIQQSGSGSSVKIFGDGLDWSGVEEGKPSSPGDLPDVDKVEEEAMKALKGALKGLPKGF